VVRRYARIPGDRTLIAGMAMGYPKADHPLNLIRTQRGRPEEFIEWVEG
jgi:hypothetical protein